MYKKNSSEDDFMTIICVVLGLTFLLGLAIVGNFLKYKELRDYKYDSAFFIQEVEEPYLYTPYHGGVVQEKSYYYFTYCYIVDGEEYTFTLKRNTCNKPEEIKIMYNPENPVKLFIDQQAFTRTEGEPTKQDWVRYR